MDRIAELEKALRIATRCIGKMADALEKEGHLKSVASAWDLVIMLENVAEGRPPRNPPLHPGH